MSDLVVIVKRHDTDGWQHDCEAGALGLKLGEAEEINQRWDDDHPAADAYESAQNARCEADTDEDENVRKIHCLKFGQI